MRWLAILLVTVLIGCKSQGASTASGHAFVGLALAAMTTQPTPAPPLDVPAKCCSECNGTGKVRSGDGLAVLPCPCPETCPCKAKPAVSRCINCERIK